VDALKQHGLDVVSVTDVSPGLSDRAVIDLANKEDRAIITFGKDFGELVFRERLVVKGIMLLRIHPASPEYVAERIQHALTQATTVENRVVTVSEDRIRLRRQINKPL